MVGHEMIAGGHGRFMGEDAFQYSKKYKCRFFQKIEEKKSIYLYLDNLVLVNCLYNFVF